MQLSVFIMVIAIFIIFIINLLKKNPPPPILNVYQRPNRFYWLKVIFMYLILSIKKLSNIFRKKDLSHYEKTQKLSSHPNAIDAVYFNGANKTGDYLVSGTARRKNNLVDGFLYLLLEETGLGLLETPKLPGTSLYQNEETEEYGAEGLKVTPIVPMKKWQISYNGPMKKHEQRNETVSVQLEVEYTSKLPIFNMDTDLDPWAMASSMAYERFSREYFENLKTNHQTHYEQHGDIDGTAIIEGKPYKIHVNAVRDHSFGTKREWRNFHRYGLHFVTAENGDRFNVGMICMPISFSRLSLGYVYSAADRKLYPVTSNDFQLYQHGEDGQPPLDYAFSFAAGSKHYTMKVKVIHSPHFYLSKDWESKVIERLCTFEINGVKGWGAAEWQYRNISGKNVSDYNGF